MTDTPESGIAQALADGKGRSAIYRWLWRHYAEIQAALDDLGGRPAWDKLGPLMERDGIVTARGNTPSADTIRRQWNLVVKKKQPRARDQPKQAPQRASTVMDFDGEGLTFAGGPRKGKTDG